jgi:hypothetical protein
MLPQINLSPMHFSQQPPLDLRLGSNKKISFGLLSFTTRSNSFGEHLLLYQHHLRLPPPIHRMERIHFSAALQSSSLRSVYIITTQFFVLRSSFCLFFLGISKTDPYHSYPPPMSDCVSFMCACVRLAAVWFRFGFRQSGSIDCSLFFPSPVLYY